MAYIFIYEYCISSDRCGAGTAPAAQDLAMAVYTSSGGSCGPFTLVVCDDNSNVGMPSATVLPPAIGTVYYLRIWSNSGYTDR